MSRKLDHEKANRETRAKLLGTESGDSEIGPTGYPRAKGGNRAKGDLPVDERDKAAGRHWRKSLNKERSGKLKKAKNSSPRGKDIKNTSSSSKAPNKSTGLDSNNSLKKNSLAKAHRTYREKLRRGIDVIVENRNAENPELEKVRVIRIFGSKKQKPRQPIKIVQPSEE